MKKFIQVVAYEAGDLLAFTHKGIEADSLEDAYDIEPDVTNEQRDKFRNWYVIDLSTLEFDD
jgi:hypothetical protein